MSQVSGIALAQPRYGSTAVAFHWIAAALMVFLGGLGVLFDEIPRAARPFWTNVHGCVGLIYFALVIARLVWRFSHQPPDIGEFDRRTSFTAHLLLYALILLIPCFGIAAYIWHGRAIDYGLFTLNLGAVSDRSVFHPACSGWIFMAM